MTKNKILAEMAKRGYVPRPSLDEICPECALYAQSYFGCSSHPVARAMHRMTGNPIWCDTTLGGTPNVWVLMPTHELPKE